MKKKIINGILMVALVGATSTSFVSCKDTSEDVKTDLMAQVNAVKANLEPRVEQAEKDIDALEGRMDTAESDIKTLKSDVTSLKNRVSTLEQEKDSLAQVTKTIEGQLTQVETKINTIVEALQKMVTSVTVNATSTNILENSKLFPGVNMQFLGAIYGEAKKDVSVPFAILGGTTEEVTISVAPQSATVYGVGEMKFTITRDFVWEYLGEGVYTSWLFGESWPQPVYRGEGTHLYKLPGCIAEGYDIEFELTEDDQHLAKPIATQETGYVDDSYGMISLTNGVGEDGNPYDIAREDNIIYLPIKYIVSAGSFGTNYDSIELPE